MNASFVLGIVLIVLGFVIIAAVTVFLQLKIRNLKKKWGAEDGMS